MHDHRGPGPRPPPLALLALSALAACSGDGGPSADSAGGSTTFPNTFPWTQADTESTPTVPTTDPTVTIHGTFSYREELDGVPRCDTSVEFSGARYTGDCPNCAFAFTIDTVVQTDDNDPLDWHCARLSNRLVEDEVYKNLRLAWADPWDGGLYGVLDRTILVGASVDLTSQGYGYYPGPNWYPVASAPYGAPSFDGANVELDYVQDYDYSFQPSWGYCGSYLPAGSLDATLPPGPADSIPCDGSEIAKYTLDLAAGDSIGLSADTVDAGTAADLHLWVTAPDGCTVAYADDEVPCTFGGDQFLCPTLSFEAQDAGSYAVYVGAYSNYPPYFYGCPGSAAGFTFAAEGADVRSEGHEPQYVVLPFHSEKRLSATIEGDL